MNYKETYQGKHGKADVFAKMIDENAKAQIEDILDQPFVDGNKTVVMPDVHAGKGSVVGTTVKVTNGRVVPNIVGVDIGCGIMVSKLPHALSDDDFVRLDDVIHQLIPAGKNVRTSINSGVRLLINTILQGITFDLRNKEHIYHSLGTLGGGNHFISVEKGQNNDYYLLVHTGSRALGVQVANHHQKLAVEQRTNNTEDLNAMIAEYKAQGRQNELQEKVLAMKAQAKEKAEQLNKDYAYLEGDLADDYLHDMNSAQTFAYFNRRIITGAIFNAMDWRMDADEQFDSVHNYFDIDEMMIRKGATAANKGQKLIIPLNMRDGSVIAVGKGNAEWNNSAPHGAGRVLSRTQAREQLSVDEMTNDMQGIYTTTANENTIDEAPKAYKPIDAILDVIGDTVDIVDRVHTVYNFKG